MTIQICSNIYVQNENGFTKKTTLFINQADKKLLDAIKQSSKNLIIMHDPKGTHCLLSPDKVIVFHPGDRAESLYRELINIYQTSHPSEELSISDSITTSSSALVAEEFVTDIFGTQL